MTLEGVAPAHINGPEREGASPLPRAPGGTCIFASLPFLPPLNPASLTALQVLFPGDSPSYSLLRDSGCQHLFPGNLIEDDWLHLLTG